MQLKQEEHTFLSDFDEFVGCRIDHIYVLGYPEHKKTRDKYNKIWHELREMADKKGKKLLVDLDALCTYISTCEAELAYKTGFKDAIALIGDANAGGVKP